MDARVGFDKYPYAVSRSLNLIALPQGGLTFRPGTRFVKEIKTSSSKAALYGVEPTAGRGYVLEFGNGYIRFYANQSRLAAATSTASITNGTFATDIVGWTNRSTGSATIAWSATGGGRMLLDGAANGYAWCEQAVNPDPDKVHVFRFTLAGSPGVTATVQIGNASLGGDLWNKSGYGVGQHTVALNPGASGLPIYFQVINKQNDDLFLDNVEILSNTPLELTNSPYTAAQVESLRIAQSNDVFYIFHPSHATRKIERRGDYSWSLTEPFFEDGPWGEINPEIDLAESNLVKNPTFEGGLGEYWIAVQPGGSAIEYDGSQGVVFFREVGADDPSLYQAITTGASAALHIMHFQIVGQRYVNVKIGTTIGGVEIRAATDYSAGWYTISFTPGAATFYIYFTKGGGGDAIIPGLGGVFIFNTRHNLLQASATTGSVTVTALGDFKPFASTDVNRSIRIEHAGREPGWGVITAFTDSQTVTVRLYRKVASTIATETWRLGSWSTTTGFPALGIFYQQRLLGTKTTDQPQTLWGAQSGDFQNFRPDSWEGGANTTEDDDSFAYTLGAKRGSPIQWLTGTRKLIAGTATGQWVITSRGIALTPADLSAEPHTSIRGANLEALEIDTVSLFIERDKQSVHDLGYNYEIDGFQAADLNILADHIAGSSSFEQLVFQSKPYALVWARKADGTLGVLTYKRQQNVVGWAPATIAGSLAGAAVVESLAVIPGAAPQSVSAGTSETVQAYDSSSRDELWMIVKRTINGATTRYIEVMEGFFRGPNRVDYNNRSGWLSAMLTNQADAFYVDSGITYSGASVTTITGLSHLNGESVYVNGNGLVQGPFTVSGGQITGLTAVTKAQAGLNYGWRVRGLKANYGAQSGSSVGQQKSLGPFAAVLLDAGTFDYGVETTGEKGRDASFISMSTHLPSSLALFTGEVYLDKAPEDWGDTDPRFIFKGTSPMPWTFLGLMMKTATNEK